MASGRASSSRAAWVLIPLENHASGPKELLAEDCEVTIGRSRTCTMRVLDDPHVSQTHCTLLQSADLTILEVLDCSKNGTCVNGDVLRKGQRRRVYHGDILSLTWDRSHNSSSSSNNNAVSGASSATSFTRFEVGRCRQPAAVSETSVEFTDTDGERIQFSLESDGSLTFKLGGSELPNVSDLWTDDPTSTGIKVLVNSPGRNTWWTMIPLGEEHIAKEVVRLFEKSLQEQCGYKVFRTTVNKMARTSLGIKIVHSGEKLRIVRIESDGLIAELNKTSETPLRVDDEIIEVNGIKGTARVLADEIKSKTSLVLKVSREDDHDDDGCKRKRTPTSPELPPPSSPDHHQKRSRTAASDASSPILRCRSSLKMIESARDEEDDAAAAYIPLPSPSRATRRLPTAMSSKDDKVQAPPEPELAAAGTKPCNVALRARDLSGDFRADEPIQIVEGKVRAQLRSVLCKALIKDGTCNKERALATATAVEDELFRTYAQNVHSQEYYLRHAKHVKTTLAASDHSDLRAWILEGGLSAEEFVRMDLKDDLKHRLQVRSHLRQALVHGESDGDDQLQAARAVAGAMEEEVFRLYGGAKSPRYRRHARMLKANLSAAGNEELRSRLVGGGLRAEELVHMDSAELATQDLRSQREEALRKSMIGVVHQDYHPEQQLDRAVVSAIGLEGLKKDELEAMLP